MISGRNDLGELLEEFHRARARHREQLRGRLDTAMAQETRDEMLAALETYIAELDRRHFPTPPALKSELTLLRILSTHRRRPASPRRDD